LPLRTRKIKVVCFCFSVKNKINQKQEAFHILVLSQQEALSFLREVEKIATSKNKIEIKFILFFFSKKKKN